MFLILSRRTYIEYKLHQPRLRARLAWFRVQTPPAPLGRFSVPYAKEIQSFSIHSSEAEPLAKARGTAGEIGYLVAQGRSSSLRPRASPENLAAFFVVQGRSSSLKLGAPPGESGLRRHVGSSEAWPLAKARRTAAGGIGFLVAQRRSSSLKLRAPPEKSVIC